MGFSVIVTPEDLKKTERANIPPTWYLMEIVKYETVPTKGSDDKPSDGSINAVFHFKLLDGPEGVKGRELRRFFNEKYFGYGKDLWRVLFNWKAGQPLTEEMFNSTVGQRMLGYVKKNKEGYDNVEDWRPLPTA